MRARGDGGRRVIDMQDLFYRFTMDSIGCIAFGKSLGCLQVTNLAMLSHARLLFISATDQYLGLAMLNLLSIQSAACLHIHSPAVCISIRISRPGPFCFGLYLFFFHQREQVEFADAFDRAQFVTDKRFLLPCWRAQWCCPWERDLRACVRTLNAFAGEIIDERRAESVGAEWGPESGEMQNERRTEKGERRRKEDSLWEGFEKLHMRVCTR